MISTAIYLDNNATTPLAQESLDALIKENTAPVGNPSSVHRFGQAAKKGYKVIEIPLPLTSRLPPTRLYSHQAAQNP